MNAAAPKFHRIGPGVYDTADGKYTMYRIEGVSPPAWNVEYGTDWMWDHDGEDSFDTIVDGAESKKAAMAIFTRWFSTAPPPR